MGQKAILAAKTPTATHTHRSRMQNCCIYLVGGRKKKRNDNKTSQCWMFASKLGAGFSQLVKIGDDRHPRLG